jgi:hypothetical protein
MIIDIEDDLFYKIIKIVKSRNIKVYEQLQIIEPLKVNTNDTLSNARDIKTKRVKQSIKTTLKELIKANINPTKYQMHKRTKIAYVTLNKYYDDILKEITDEH